jgi:hypothetical protein
MVKKSAVILGVLAILTIGVGMSWGYTVTQWPVPGIPNTVFCGGSACLVTPEDVTLRGPVAPACEPPLIPGVIHAALSIPFRACAIVATPLFQGGAGPGAQCCPVDLGEPAYVLAAVPCTPVNVYTPPKGW